MSYLIDGGAHIDRLLTNLAIKGFSGREGFIGDQLFPTVPVERQSNYYPIIDSDTWLRVEDTKRAPGVPAKMNEFKLSSEQYFADNYAFGTDYPKEMLSQSDLGASRLRTMHTNYVVEMLMRDREQRIANIITSIDNVGSGTALTGTNRWSDSVGSDPIGDANSAQAFIHLNTGLTANTLATDRDTFITLQQHPAIRDYVKYTTGGPVTRSAIADLFNVDNILVAMGIFNSGKEDATASLQTIWGNFASFLHIQNAVGMETMTFGLAFQWRPAEFPTPMVVERYDHHNRSAKKEIQEAQYFQDEKVVAQNLAYTINDTI